MSDDIKNEQNVHAIFENEEKLEFKIFIGGYGSDPDDNDPGSKTKLVSGDIMKWAQNEEQMKHRSGNGFGFGFEPITTISVPMFDTTSSEKITLPLPAGLIGLYGPSGAGKTHLLQYMLNKVKDPFFVRFNEPELPITHFSPNDVIESIEDFLESDSLVGGIDSFRFWVYNTLGRSAAGKGGISTGLYSDLTQLSNALAMKGKTLIVVINPMSPDADSRAAVLNALDGSLAGVIEAISYGKFSYKARTSENMRNNKTYTIDFKDGKSIDDGDVVQRPEGRRVKRSGDLGFSDASIKVEKTNVDTSYVVFSRLFRKQSN